MEFRQRIVLAAIWFAVAVLLASIVESVVPETVVGVIHVFAIALALFLAGVYLLDPWNVVSKKHAFVNDD